MGRIDSRVLRAARLAGATLLAVGAVDVVLRGHSLTRNEEGAILLAAGAALLGFHIILARTGDAATPDALLAAALAVPLIPIGSAILAFSPSTAPDFQGDLFSPYREAGSVGLIAAAFAYAATYLVTRHPRWVLVCVLALGFGGEFRTAAPIPLIGVASESWKPALTLTGCAAVATLAAIIWRAVGDGERLNLLVGAAVLFAAASQARAGVGGTADASRDIFLGAILAAQVGIAWYRTTPAVGVGVVVSGGMLAASLAQRSGLIGVALALAGAALAAGTMLWERRSGGGPAAEPPASAA